MKKISMLVIILLLCFNCNLRVFAEKLEGEDLSDYFGTMRACKKDGSKNDCRNGNEYKFYLKMYDIYYLYKNKYNVELDLPLIMAALYYNDEQLPTVFKNNLNPYNREEVNNGNNVTNLDWEYDYKKENCYQYLNSKDNSYDMQILAKNMVTKTIKYKCSGDNSEKVVKDIETSNYSTETLKCDNGQYDERSISASYKLDKDKYDKFLLEYIKLKYHTKGDSTKKCDISNNSCSTIGTIYAECSGITVNGYGTYSLEDYVAGVIGPEFGSLTDNDEAAKAYGIAIRTFALNNTNNCKTSIAGDTTKQVFTGDTKTYKDKVALSQGLVATDSKGLFPVSYALSRPADCENSSGGMCTIKRCHTYADSLSSCTTGFSSSVIPVNILNWNGYTHFGGLEAYIAHYLAQDKKYNAEQILKHFYGDNVAISSLNGNTTATSNNFCSSGANGNSRYVESDGVKFPVKNYNIEGTSSGLGKEFNLSASNVSQCPWYAKYRAIEIVMTSSLSNDLKQKAKSVLLATNGNGNDWYGGNNNTLKYFQYSSDVTKPKAGAIVSWNRNSHGYGHVGIVEEVYSDGSILLSEGWNRFGADGKDSINSIKIISRKMSQEEIKTYGGTGTFIGYTYLFTHKQ